MTRRVLRALKGSIKKWENIVLGKGVDMGTSNCPLCAEFWNKTGSCSGCPVSEKTGKTGCLGTPYDSEFINKHDRYSSNDSKGVVDALKEVEFLRSLLPKNECKTRNSG